MSELWSLLSKDLKDCDVWGNAAFLGSIYTETPKTSPSECTCDSKDLANFGCKCGWIERERELRKEKEDAN